MCVICSLFKQSSPWETFDPSILVRIVFQKDEEIHRKRNKKSKKHSKHKKSKKRKNEKKKKRKKRKSESQSSVPIISPPKKTIVQLRAERLKREQEERKRINKLLAKERGETVEEETVTEVPDDRDRQYNSQFNPDLVRRPKKKRPEYLDMI